MAHDITKDVIGCKEFEVQDINISGESANYFGAITQPDHIITKGFADGAYRPLDPGQGDRRVLFEGIGPSGGIEISDASFTVSAFTNVVNVAGLASADQVTVVQPPSTDQEVVNLGYANSNFRPLTVTGSDGEILFNNSGSEGSSSDLKWDNVAKMHTNLGSMRVGSTAAGANITLSVGETIANPSGNLVGGNLVTTLQGALNSKQGFGFQGNVNIQNLTENSTGEHIAVQGSLVMASGGANTISAMTCFKSLGIIIVSGTITDFIGYKVTQPTRIVGGSITNLYGLKVEDQTIATNNWAIKTGLGSVSIGDHAEFNGNVSINNGKDLRLFDPGSSNYVGWKAPALTANQIWTLPDADGADGDVMFTNGAGILKWGANASTRAFTFSSPSGGSGVTYAAGHYRFGASDDDFNPVINFGTANGSYADHVFVVAAAGATDTEITVTGTSITDAGVRSASDTEVLSLTDAGADTYYETSKKWLGLVTIEKTAGTDRLCNYGGCKYWDDNNENFKVEGIEATWLGGAADTGANIILRHHKTTGWTYNSGAAPTPPTPIDSMNGDHVTEINIINGEEGAWKRTNLATSVDGSGSEGILLEIVTSANKAFEIGNILIRVVPQ